MLSMHHLLKAVLDKDATDLHLVVGSPPALRVNGEVVKVKTEPLTADDTKKLCYAVLTDAQKATFEETKELDFSFGIKGVSRFRGNLFYQKGQVSGAFRKIPF